MNVKTRIIVGADMESAPTFTCFLLDSAQLLISCRLKMLIASLKAFYTEVSLF